MRWVLTLVLAAWAASAFVYMRHGLEHHPGDWVLVVLATDDLGVIEEFSRVVSGDRYKTLDDCEDSAGFQFLLDFPSESTFSLCIRLQNRMDT